MLTIPDIKAKLGSRYRKALIKADPTLTGNKIKWALSGECDDTSRIQQVQNAATKAILDAEQFRKLNEALKTNR